MFLGALISGFVNILVYSNKYANNFGTAWQIFFFEIEIIEINSHFIWPYSSKIVDIL